MFDLTTGDPDHDVAVVLLASLAAAFLLVLSDQVRAFRRTDRAERAAQDISLNPWKSTIVGTAGVGRRHLADGGDSVGEVTDRIRTAALAATQPESERP